jgi:flagellar biosynthesis/type III secretory pathway protein FliH
MITKEDVKDVAIHEKGKADGHSNGCDEGETGGYSEGYEKGHQEGYGQGHAEGYEAATKELADKLTSQVLEQEIRSQTARKAADTRYRNRKHQGRINPPDW